MAKKIEEARVRQKADTLENWNNNDLPLLDGEQAFIRSDVDDMNIGFKLGSKNKKFSELPYPDYSVRGKVSPSSTWIGRQSGVYIPTLNGTYNGITVNLGEGYQVLFWDGETLEKVVYPADFTGLVFGGVIDDSYDLSNPEEAIWYIASPGTYNTAPPITLTEQSILTWNNKEWSHVPFELEVRGEFLVADNVEELRNITPQVASLLTNGTYKGVTLLGYYEKGDTPAPIEYYLSYTTEEDDGGSVFEVGGIKLKTDFKEELNILFFGAHPSNSDNLTYISKALDYCKTKKVAFVIPEGRFSLSNSPNFVSQNLVIKGCGLSSILHFTGTKGMTFDAFESGSVNDPFIQGMDIKDFIVEGNTSIKKVIYTRGQARCKFKNIWVKEGSFDADGYGWYLAGTQLCSFDFCGVSTKITPMTNVINVGIALDTGARGSVTVGNCSNNTFLQCYFEGLNIGILGILSDQNYFIGGAPEDCITYGAVMSANSRYNTFIGVGFENKEGAIDLSDSGKYNTYKNCYSGRTIRFGAQSLGCEWSHGYNAGIDIQTGATNIKISNVTYNYFNVAGISDLGTGTIRENLLNHVGSVMQPNNRLFTGFLDVKAGIKVIANNNINTPANYVDMTGTSYANIISSNTGGFPNNGVTFNIDRSSKYDDTTALGSFKLYSRQDSVPELFLTKKIASTGAQSDWSSLRKIITNSDLATTTTNGLVKQAESLPAGSTADQIITVLKNAGLMAT